MEPLSGSQSPCPSKSSLMEEAAAWPQGARSERKLALLWNSVEG